MDIHNQPGIIEEYCLGLLSEKDAAAVSLAASREPALKKQIEEIEKAIGAYAGVNARPSLKDAILTSLGSLPYITKIDVAHPPPISRHSDITDWNEAIAHIEPDKDHGHIKTRFISFNPELQLCIAWLYGKLEEDEHHEDEFEESFLILEGNCECNIDGKIYRLQGGNYLDIPFNAKHTITSTSPQGYVKAIIQRRKSAV